MKCEMCRRTIRPARMTRMEMQTGYKEPMWSVALCEVCANRVLDWIYGKREATEDERMGESQVAEPEDLAAAAEPGAVVSGRRGQAAG